MAKAIVGYTDAISVAPGEMIRFMVSCDPAIGPYQAGIVRMICGDTQPGGPGLKQRPVPSTIDGLYPARHQPIRAGAFVLVPDHPGLARLHSLTVLASIFPTRLDGKLQTIISRLNPASGLGFALCIDASGRLCLRLGPVTVTSTALPLRERKWCRIAVTFDHASGAIRFVQTEQDKGLSPARSGAGEANAAGADIGCGPAPLLIGAAAGCAGSAPWGAACFNGRIEHPTLFAAALDSAGIERVWRDGAAAWPGQDCLGAWDFSQEMSTDRVIDVSGNACHGRTVNLPLRAVRGSAWDGRQRCWGHDPSQYGAMHFLDDAIQDCRWEADFAWTVPEGLPSGCYAAWLRANGQEDHIPFFVRPPRTGPTQRLALLIPTFSYLAYANWRLPFENPAAELLMNALPVLGAEDAWLLEHPEIGPSLYDTYNDGTSACYASRLRPNLNMRPSHPWLEQYPADLFLVDWLDAQQIPVDVITDDDLHAEGEALLAHYQCIMTGTHPEYYSTPMWDGLQDYLCAGGRMMYMGGNGFVWRVGVMPGQPGTIELRRGEAGSSIGANEPGEYYMSSTGEYGGQWSKIGRAPNVLAGVGYIAQGFDFSAGYRRLPGSFDPRAAFIFAGIAEDEVIGGFGLQGHGAAGVEIDRFDVALGTPPHALRLATSAGYHTATYRFATMAGLDAPEVRADLTYFETPCGGAVFSVGSMAWAASMSHDDYANNVSRITANVLHRFLDPAPLNA